MLHWDTHCILDNFVFIYILYSLYYAESRNSDCDLKLQRMLMSSILTMGLMELEYSVLSYQL